MTDKEGGIFPKEFSKKIHSLLKDREVSDYSYLLSISKEQAEEDLKSAEEIIRAVEVYLCREVNDM